MGQEKAPQIDAAALLDGSSTDDLIRQYDRVGAIIVRGLIDAHWLTELRAIYDDMAEDAVAPFADGRPRTGIRQLVNRHQMWRDVDRFRAFLFGSPIARAAAMVMRSNSATLYEDILISEPAGSTSRSGWHQDEPTWPVSGLQLSSVWFSLEPVGEQTGAMRYLRGTHRGPLYHPAHISGEEAGEDVRFWTGGAFPDVDGFPNDNVVVLTDATPGDAIIFHPRAIHTSYGSTPDHARRSFTIRFLGDDVRWLPKTRLFHPWMKDLALQEGDRVVSDRLPLIWAA